MDFDRGSGCHYMDEAYEECTNWQPADWVKVETAVTRRLDKEFENTDAVLDVTQKLMDSQTDLAPEAARILHENKWDLYDGVEVEEE
jgi:hypothetical protein